MSEAAPETPSLEAKLEALAAEGFHLVFSGVERYIIEKVDHVGTQSFEGKTLEEVIGYVEDKLSTHPGSPVDIISRSDGTHESIDALAAQAGRPAPAEGGSGTSPSAPVEKVDVAAIEAATAAENSGAGANVAAPDSEPATLADPAAQAEAAAPAEEAPAVDTSGLIAETPGEVATGPIGTPEDAPEAEAAPVPEGAVES